MARPRNARRGIARAALLIALPLLIGARLPHGVAAAPVDPLRVADDDFARHRSAAEWRGLTVTRLSFAEERASWVIWRIEDRARPRGPLWVVPHDNENAGFEAALASLRRYGGTIMAVDSGDGGGVGQRRNAAVAYGPPVDPNRNFHDGLPIYARTMLSPLAQGAWPIIALHTNQPGYNPRGSLCPPLGDTSGEGVISIRYCDEVLTPSRSPSQAWPFDDDDNVAFATFLASKGRDSAFCGRRMVAADFNVIFERVANTDGSLSNYAVLEGLDYLNFEARERGLEPAALAQTRDALVAMVDKAMAMCGTDRPATVPRL